MGPGSLSFSELRGDADDRAAQIDLLFDSPLRKIDWSPSLETPNKHRRAPSANILQRLRGLPPTISTDGAPGQMQELADWSASMETPPRRGIIISEANDLVPLNEVRDTLVEKLRGIPSDTPPPREERSPSISSQEGSFYSASSSMAPEGNGYQTGLASGSVGFASEDSLMRGGVTIDMTLPSTMMRQLEQDSPVIGELEMPSQILSDSQSDNIFNVISNSAIAHELSNRSNDSLRRPFPTQLISPDTQFWGPDVGVRVTNNDLTGSGAAQGAGTPGAVGMFVTQDAGDVALDQWDTFFPISSDQEISGNNNQEPNNDEQDHFPSTIEVNSDDDFGNIRFSQLDDGFNVVPDASQNSQMSQPLVKTEQVEAHINDPDWLSTSAAMLQDSGDNLGPANSVCEETPRPPPSFALGGFTSASGKQLAPLSKDALARVSALFDNDDGDFDLARKEEDPYVSSASTHAPAPVTFGGFQTAGKKAPLPISKAAQDRAALLFQTDDPETSTSMPPSLNSGIGLTEQSNLQSKAPMHFGGFTSGAGKKLASVSKEALKKWSKELMEDDVSEPASRTLQELGSPRSAIESADSSSSHVSAPLQLGGFTSGTGKKLPTVSKDAMNKWLKEFAEEDTPTLNETDTRRDRIASKTSSISIAPPKSLIGFASGTGKALAPISKEAQERAFSFLEISEPLAPASVSSKGPHAFSSGGSRLSLSGTSGIRPLLGSAVGTTQQPTISSHMDNLKRRSLRGSTAGSSLSGIMKPPLKARAPFKPPQPFKSPLRRTNDQTTPGGAAVEPTGGASIDNTGTDTTSRVTSTTHATIPRMSTGKRATLHPNARPNNGDALTSTSHQPSKVTPSYKSLYNLTVEGSRIGLRDALGLPTRLSVEKLLELGVSENAIKMTLFSARDYRFDDWGVEEAYHDLIALGAKPDLLSKVWLSNHYRLIVWKLACYIRTWPEYFMSEFRPWFAPARVVDQLSYRYEREINRAERPALRKVVEGDESAAKHMVLCIASITTEYSEEAKQDVMKVAVTDGWYILPAALDQCLTRAVEKGKLQVGSKIHICRAKLSGSESGVAILELADAGASSSSVSLVLQANSTRLARWDTKLGFHRMPMIWTTRLRCIQPEGGLVPGLDVVVLRKYPLMFLETLEDGITKVKRTAIEEDRAAEAHRERVQTRYQDMVQEVERELGVDASPHRIQEEIQARAGDLQAQASARNVTPFFTIRVGNCSEVTGYDHRDDDGLSQEALVTFWHADYAPYQEGHRVRMTCLMAKRSSREFGGEEIMQLTGTRMTTVREMPTDPEAMLLTTYRAREITACVDIEHLYHGAEVDLAVIILAIGEGVTSANKVYFVVTDASAQLLLIEHQVSPHPSSSAPGQAQSLPSFLKIQSRILVANARYKMHDAKLGLDIVSSVQSYTQITAATNTSSRMGGWPPYAQPSLARLDELSHGKKEGPHGLLKLLEKANTVLESMRPTL
ncbi:Breast cancer 2, early onset [Dissophora globulifera]|uniref:Breast cancer 2, early onset n=1 Tax=Dissophora globulifera TaxID=979702 RepID=A0A9P6RNW3_9FUNG|nr:Breast cancer 2, early onset [Dissophora globulifera]